VDFYAVEWNTTEEKPTAENIFQQVDPVGFADYQSDNQAINGQFAGYDVLQMFCPKCPEGADCQEAGTTINDVSPLEGYFPGSDNDGIISNVIFVACLNEACVGGVECADDDEFCYCAEDYTGQYCTACADGFVTNAQFECRECPSKAVLVTLGLFLGIACVTILVFMIRDIQRYAMSEHKDKEPPYSILGKIITSGFQVNVLALTFSFNWPSWFESMLDFEGAITSFGTHFLEFTCMQDKSNTSKSTFISETIFIAFIPFLFILVIMGGLELYLQLDLRLKLRWLGPTVPTEPAKFRKWSMYFCKTAFLVILFFLQPLLASRTFLTMACVDVGTDKSVLVRDLDVVCGSPDHGWLLFLGVLMLLVYVIGLPVGIASLLYHKFELIRNTDTDAWTEMNFFIFFGKRTNTEMVTSKEEQQMKSFEGKYGLVFGGYKKQYAWWEVMVLLRKLYMAAIGALLTFDIQAQGLFGLVGLFFFGFAHIIVQPYADSSREHHGIDLNAMESLSLLTSCLTYFCGQFTWTDDLDADPTTAGAFALLIQLTFLFICVGMYLKLYRSSGGTFTVPKINFLGMLKATNQEKIPSETELTCVPGKETKESANVTEETTFEEYFDMKIPGWQTRMDAIRAFMESEYSDENIKFWLDVNQFRIDVGAQVEVLQLWEKATAVPLGEEFHARVVEITNKYVREEAEDIDEKLHTPVNLAGKIATPILAVVGTEAEPGTREFTVNMLDDAFTAISKLIERDTWPRFTDGDHWEKLKLT
jgi:hypothetical protein